MMRAMLLTPHTLFTWHNPRWSVSRPPRHRSRHGRGAPYSTNGEEESALLDQRGRRRAPYSTNGGGGGRPTRPTGEEEGAPSVSALEQHQVVEHLSAHPAVAGRSRLDHPCLDVAAATTT